LSTGTNGRRNRIIPKGVNKSRARAVVGLGEFDSRDSVGWLARHPATRRCPEGLCGGLERAGYIVVEVGIFPLPGKDIDISPDDFMLFPDAGKVATRSVDATAIAGVIGRDHSSQRRPSELWSSDVYVTAGASISRIPVADPATGRQSHATVVGTEEGVSNGPPVGYPAPGAAPNPGAIEQELWAKSLPGGKTAVAVAGYVYFPKPSGKANGVWELMLDGTAGRVKLTLQR
jgi:hypothetical protein